MWSSNPQNTSQFMISYILCLLCPLSQAELFVRNKHHFNFFMLVHFHLLLCIYCAFLIFRWDLLQDMRQVSFSFRRIVHLSCYYCCVEVCDVIYGSCTWLCLRLSCCTYAIVIIKTLWFLTHVRDGDFNGTGWTTWLSQLQRNNSGSYGWDWSLPERSKTN